MEQELRAAKAALEDETAVLAQLNHIGAMLASNLDTQSVVQAVTDAGTRLSGAQFGAFFYTVKGSSGDTFTLYTLSGAPKELFDQLEHPRATPLLDVTFRGERVVRLADVRTDPRYGQWGPFKGMPPGHPQVASYLAVPVVSRTGEVIGALMFGHARPDVFGERSERIVTGIAAHAAIAIDNARLHEETRRAVDAERAARSEIERVSMMKDEFLATLSHELRTPLNAVLGWAEMLLARSAVDSEQRRGLETIARNARAQAQLIDDLLDMNRIVSGKIRLDVQRLDLLGVVEAAIESVRPSAAAKGIALRALLDPLTEPVHGDPHRVQQIVWNLLSNAVKFTPRGGKIDVVLRRVNSHVEICVADTGIGIQPQFLPHVFDRFRQADASTTRKYGGLGLGLSIVRQLVELHGGTVRAESAGADRGATFVIALPLRVVRDPAPAEHPTTTTAQRPAAIPPEISLAGVKVLVIDDEADARALLEIVLGDAGAQVTVAASSDEALAKLAATAPDVIVSDIGMPDRDGYQLMRSIRILPPERGGRTPAVALTAFARSEDRTRALLAGYQVHITKPIEPLELIVTLASLTGRT